MLGIFGRQGVFTAGEWPTMKPFIGGGFEMYRNYDGKNGKFGDTSVSAQTSDNSSSSIYASLDSTDPSHMVLVAINKNTTSLTTNMNIQNAPSFMGSCALADIYQLTSASSNPVWADSVLITNPANFSYNMPGYSVSTINIRAGSGLNRNLVWSQAGATWDTANSGNRPWQTDSHAAFFLQGDQATFGNTGVGTVVVSASGVSPNVVNIQNTTGTYTFTGGSISGAAKVEITGGGNVVFSNNNTYTGSTDILAGSLMLSSQGQISPFSLINNQTKFEITGGSHTLGIITGAGQTTIDNGAQVTVDAFSGHILTLKAGSSFAISPLGTTHLNAGDITPVPEPSVLLGLVSAAVFSLLFKPIVKVE